MIQVQERDLLPLQKFWSRTHGQPGPNEIPVAQLLQLAYLTDREEYLETGQVTSGRTWKRCPTNVVTSPELYRMLTRSRDRYAPRAGVVAFLHTENGLSSPWRARVEEFANNLSPLALKGYVRHLPEIISSEPYDSLLT